MDQAINKNVAVQEITRAILKLKATKTLSTPVLKVPDKVALIQIYIKFY